jgi:hypothetical protein
MRFLCSFRWLVMALGVILAGAWPAAAQQMEFPPEQHAWGKFPVGAWKYVRTTAETLNDKGHVTNVAITDTRTTLTAADDTSYTLRSEVTLDVLGRRIATTPHVAKYGYYGETLGQTISVKRVGDATLTIDGRTVPCELRQVSMNGDSGKLVSTLHYAHETAPFVLRRESSVDGAADDKRNTTLVEVIALNLPYRVLGETRPVSYIKTTQNLPQGKKVTVEFHSADVPGGVVSHSANETDATGRVVRRSTLELLGFGQPPAAEVVGGMTLRPRRAAKNARRMDPR